MLRIYLATCLTAIGGFLYGYDTGVISGVLTVKLFRQDMGITESNAKEIIGNILAALQIGGTVGAIVQSFINDRW